MTDKMTEHFSRKEFACKCGCGSDNISRALVLLLQNVRDEYPFPISISSGIRCQDHNHAVGGVEDSAHLKGLAADLVCYQAHSRFMLLRQLLHWFDRIIIYKDFIHVDIDDSKPSPIVLLK